jgi:outer membrane lipoprotein-sorting protein
MRCILFLLVAGLLLSFPTVYAQQEQAKDPIEEFFKKVDKNYYYPTEHGLKDLQVEGTLSIGTVVDSVAGRQVMRQQAEFIVYFKTLNKFKIEFDTGNRKYEAQVRKTFESYIIPQPRVSHYKKDKDLWEWKLEEDKDGYTVIKIPTEANIKDRRRIKEVRERYDKNCRIKKVETTDKRGQNTVLEFSKTVEHEKKLHISECKIAIKDPEGEQMVEICTSVEYAKVDKIWLVEQITQEVESSFGGMSIQITQTLTFENHQVNEGVDDEIFE